MATTVASKVEKIVLNAIKKGSVTLEGLVLQGRSIRRLANKVRLRQEEQEVRCLRYKDKDGKLYAIVFLDTEEGNYCAAVWENRIRDYKWVGYMILER